MRASSHLCRVRRRLGPAAGGCAGRRDHRRSAAMRRRSGRCPNWRPTRGQPSSQSCSWTGKLARLPWRNLEEGLRPIRRLTASDPHAGSRIIRRRGNSFPAYAPTPPAPPGRAASRDPQRRAGPGRPRQLDRHARSHRSGVKLGARVRDRHAADDDLRGDRGQRRVPLRQRRHLVVSLQQRARGRARGDERAHGVHERDDGLRRHERRACSRTWEPGGCPSRRAPRTTRSSRRSSTRRCRPS